MNPRTSGCDALYLTTLPRPLFTTLGVFNYFRSRFPGETGTPQHPEAPRHTRKHPEGPRSTRKHPEHPKPGRKEGPRKDADTPEGRYPDTDTPESAGKVASRHTRRKVPSTQTPEAMAPGRTQKDPDTPESAGISGVYHRYLLGITSVVQDLHLMSSSSVSQRRQLYRYHKPKWWARSGGNAAYKFVGQNGFIALRKRVLQAKGVGKGGGRGGGGIPAYIP